jgi:hypothetical protein
MQPKIPLPPALPPQIQRMLDSEPGTEALVHGTPCGEPRIGMVLKRTYRTAPDGGWELAAPEDQDMVVPGVYLYAIVDPPFVAPVRFDNDGAAFRAATDVVVQCYAQTYGVERSETTVGIRFGDFSREIRVQGDREAEWVEDGTVRFSPPASFDEMSITYDRAYGGFDAVALERWRNPEWEALRKARPEYQLEASTPFHYPRNPAGVGYLIQLDEESVSRVRVPNLDYPDDPVTAERLAVGHPDRWMAGPLPACMDWTSADWFPRCCYLGGERRPEGYDGPVAEIERGWIGEEVFEIPFVLETGTLRQEFAQAASPGMSFSEVPWSSELELTNLHPEHPAWRFHLPYEVPDAKLALGGPSLTELTPHLNAVVIRPDLAEVVMIWCAHAPVSRRYSPEQAAEMRREVAWRAQT